MHTLLSSTRVVYIILASILYAYYFYYSKYAYYDSY